jgi:hypothetical protein
MPETIMWDDTVLPARVCHSPRAIFERSYPPSAHSPAGSSAATSLRDNPLCQRIVEHKRRLFALDASCSMLPHNARLAPYSTNLGGRFSVPKFQARLMHFDGLGRGYAALSNDYSNPQIA